MTMRRNIVSRFLAVLLCLAAVVSMAVPARAADWVDGDWERVTITDNGRTYNVWGFAFDSKVRNCSSLDVEVDITMKANAKCYTWNVWARSGGSFFQLGSIYLAEGSGYAYKTFKLRTAKTIDAVAITPTASGGYSYSFSLAVANAESSSGSTYVPETTEPEHEMEIPGDWKRVKIKNGNITSNTNAWMFDTIQRRVTEFTVEIDVTMYNNCSCKDWQIWAVNDNNFTKLDQIFISSGYGEGSKTVHLKNPMTIEGIAITPIKQGGFTYDLDMYIYNLKTK